jgi:hypothetical protein
MYTVIQEPFFDGHQEMVSQDAEEDVRLRAILEMVEDGPLQQRTLHGPEGRLHWREQDVGAPDLLRGQVLPVGLQRMAAIQFFSDAFFLAVLFPG